MPKGIHLTMPDFLKNIRKLQYPTLVIQTRRLIFLDVGVICTYIWYQQIYWKNKLCYILKATIKERTPYAEDEGEVRRLSNR